MEQSFSSLEGSFDSGLRSPDMFSEGEDDLQAENSNAETFWSFLGDFEKYDKRKVRKIEVGLMILFVFWLDHRTLCTTSAFIWVVDSIRA